MKKILLAGFIMGLIGCGGATDGDATTDTTSLPLDTTQSINSNTGNIPVNPPPVDSISGTSPSSRSTTPGADTTRRQ